MLLVLTFASCVLMAQPSMNAVKIVGQMKDVMWKGELYGKINLDTLTPKENLYGLGPVEYLTGEVMILDGKAYRSTVLTDSTMQVEETFAIKAPFFGYANIRQWEVRDLPRRIKTGKELEKYLDRITQSSPRPFMFKLEGVMDVGIIHIVNLPKGSTVSSPEEAHRGQQQYLITEEACEIVGFFSKEHQAIFTHHETYLHMHLITADRRKMGHLDTMLLKKGTVKLYLPGKS
jgi:acetolactate decarboxylase